MVKSKILSASYTDFGEIGRKSNKNSETQSKKLNTSNRGNKTSH